MLRYIAVSAVLGFLQKNAVQLDRLTYGLIAKVPFGPAGPVSPFGPGVPNQKNKFFSETVKSIHYFSGSDIKGQSRKKKNS